VVLRNLLARVLMEERPLVMGMWNDMAVVTYPVHTRRNAL
jgi:hypothetical protein